MIILKYNEKPEDWRTKNYKSERLEWGNAHSDVMWYTEEESRIKRISEIKTMLSEKSCYPAFRSGMIWPRKVKINGL